MTLLAVMSLSFLLPSAVGSVIKIPVHIEVPTPVNTYAGPDTKIWIDGKGWIHFKHGIGTGVVNGYITGTLTITDDSGVKMNLLMFQRLEGFITATDDTIYSFSIVVLESTNAIIVGSFLIDGAGIHIEGKVSWSPFAVYLDGIATVKS